MSKRKTLEERVRERPLGVWPFHQVVRAELDRLARQVRKLKENRSHMQCDYTWALNDVLGLIREARK